MEVAEDVLEFLDLKLLFDKECKHLGRRFHSFTCILPSTFFHKNNIENISKVVALQLRSICDSDDKFEERSLYIYQRCIRNIVYINIVYNRNIL